MDIKKLQKFVEKYKPILIVVCIILFILMVFGLYKILSSNSGAPNITKDQILIEKGGTTVTINKNGLIEYKSGSEVLYQNWDSDRVSSFFTDMESRARESLKNGKSSPCPNCYKVTLYLDGQIVTFYVEEDDEIITDIVSSFTNSDTGGNISDYFNNGTDPDSNGNGSSNSNITPTGIPSGVSPTPPPIPTSIYNPQDNYPTLAAGCDAWSGQIVGGKAIISNTLCTYNPTPTP